MGQSLAVERTMNSKNRICLWYNGTALGAARFYADTFPDSSVGRVLYAPGDYPAGKEGDVLTVEFTVAGIPCLGLNGGPAFTPNEAFSFQIATEDQEETRSPVERHRQHRGAGERLWLVQGQVGDFLADHAASADGGAARSGQGSRSARLRRHDDHAQDRYCGNRGGVEGLGGSNPTGRGHVHLVVPASPYAQDQDDLRTVDAIDDAHIARPDSTISRQGTT